MSKSRTDLELWEALEKLNDDVLSPDFPTTVLEDEIRAVGVDVPALAKRGADFVAILHNKHRLAWIDNARQRKEEMHRRAARTVSIPPMSRSQLLGRLDDLRRNPKLGTPVMTAFHKRKPEESTDEELRSLLQDIELLRALDDEDEESEPK